ncbi:hypothetical protein SBV1_1330032 [Verrucomicrobia bacterium]|nr:hypothetical protein SBV1_1330032 [Verrucomicrobiota bacterium]
MNAADRARVRRRAHSRCEYCRLHQDDSPLASLHIEHIHPQPTPNSDSLRHLFAPALLGFFFR